MSYRSRLLIAFTRFLLLPLVLFAITAVSASADDVSVPDVHVRTSDPKIAHLIRRATLESPLFRSLVARIDDSDVVVYVKRSTRLLSTLDGQLRFVGAAGGRRYVAVTLAFGLHDVRTMATIGHELQHAVEIAERPAIVDPASMAIGFAAFGYRSGDDGLAESYETTAAIHTGDRVRFELRRRVKVPDANYGVDTVK